MNHSLHRRFMSAMIEGMTAGVQVCRCADAQVCLRYTGEFLVKRVIAYYLKPYYMRMSIGFTVKFAGTIMDLCLPWILAYMIDTVIPLNDKNQIYLWGVAMLLCSVLAVTFNIIANRMAARVASDTTENIRHDLFEKIMYLSNGQVDKLTKPSLISRLTTDTYNLNQMLGRIQRLGVRAPILLLGGIMITMSLDPVLSGILVCSLPLLTAVIVLVSRKSIPMFKGLQESVDRFVRLVREDIGGFGSSRLCQREIMSRSGLTGLTRKWWIGSGKQALRRRLLIRP